MPRIKKTSIKVARAQNARSISKVKWGESYTSLLLGIIVVVVAFLLVFSFIRNNNIKTTSSVDTSNEEEIKNLPKNYEVKAGDHLWAISEKIYGSGYNWVDLASANKIENPDIISSGTKLIVPNVKPKIVTSNIQSNQETSGKKSITTGTYKIEKGDYLWDIAIRAYGDGYKWTEIAKANNLTQPDLIFSGNLLKIPR